jgi:SpoVK/Ycf46/Vps4 family AAA+-type ATPase
VMAVDDAAEPILHASVAADVSRFLRQRTQIERLVQEGIAPPRTLLLKGAPGTGKTMLAQWLARNLGLPFVVLDLATSISSFLGKTGANLRRSLDYARGAPCVILLDEFDAIGKRRDDTTEVGELKRIVNVLLKELEDWPFHSVLIAATNHPELLDPAIHRRFDVVFALPLPGQVEREKILISACGRFADELPAGFISGMANALDGTNGSELTTMTEGVVRQHIIDQIPLTRGFVGVVSQRLAAMPENQVGVFARTLRNTTDLSVRDIADLVGKSSSTVQYHLTKSSRRKEANHA